MTTDSPVHHEGDHPKEHRLARVFMWLLGVIATGLTVVLGINAVAAIQQWSSYVGGESVAVLLILGFLSVLAIAAWLATWVAWRMSRT